jgi:hypothetical protein
VVNYSGSSLTEVDAATGSLLGVVSGSAYDFDGPYAMALDGPDLFVASYGGSCSGARVTELDAATGVLVRVIRGPVYGFGQPSAMAIMGGDLFVATRTVVAALAQSQRSRSRPAPW